MTDVKPKPLNQILFPVYHSMNWEPLGLSIEDGGEFLRLKRKDGTLSIDISYKTLLVVGTAAIFRMIKAIDV